MAKTEKGPETEAREREEPPVNGRAGLARLADLTRRVMAVPKSELDLPTTSPVAPRKRAKRKRRT